MLELELGLGLGTSWKRCLECLGPEQAWKKNCVPLTDREPTLVQEFRLVIQLPLARGAWSPTSFRWLPCETREKRGNTTA